MQRFVSLTGCHFTEDVEWLAVQGLNGVNTAAPFAAQKQLVAICGCF